MSVSSAVQWWDQSQLQVLVVASLAIQSFLAIFGPRRRHHIPQWLRFVIWLSFLGGDAVAIYALATLFNRNKDVQQINSPAHESHGLEVFWTPILLMHLGGQVSISAYNLEDNELWTRHIITSLSQITVAIYVFWKSWSSSADKRILAAAILIFIPGILRCMDKPLCLRESSFNTRVHEGNNLSRRNDRHMNEEQLEGYIKEARDFIASPNPSPSSESTRMRLLNLVFIDLPRNYDVRLDNLKSFWNQEAYNGPKRLLYVIFSSFYSRSHGSVVTEYIGKRMYSFIFHGLPWLLLIVATALFHTSNKQEYRASDIIVTLTLLYGTMLVEVVSTWPATGSFRWHNMVAQHNLIELVAYATTKDTKLIRLAGHRFQVYLFGSWSMEPCNSAESITSTVGGYLKLWWGEVITDVEHYREVSSFRGQWTLESNGLVVQLGWSLEKPFAESVLIWHIATDLCFHSTDHTPPRPSQCREISNYMAHLLARKPDMLMTGSRKDLLAAAYSELLRVDQELWQDGKTIALKVMAKLKIEVRPYGNFLHDAKLLAQGLMDMGNDKMWQVIEGVWVEMLCFSAGRCTGQLHIKSIGSGGEYLSIVWLMLEHAGMESLSERLEKRSLFGHIMLQNHQNRGESDDIAPSSISQDEGAISILTES